MKTKNLYSEMVINELTSSYPNIDTKLDPREVLLRIDAIVNNMAKNNHLENWKAYGAEVDEQFITTWPSVEVVDQAGSLPSYLDLPSNYVALPMNGGINDITPIKWKTPYQRSVVITTFGDHRRYQNNPAGKMQGLLTAYPIGQRLYFTTCDVKEKYGPMIVRLVIRDSSMIASDQPYPIPADKENEVVLAAVAWFRARRAQAPDTVRDNVDQG